MAEDDPQSQKPFYGPNIWPAPGNRVKVKGFFRLVKKKYLISTLVSSHQTTHDFVAFLDILPGWRETMEKFHRQAL